MCVCYLSFPFGLTDAERIGLAWLGLAWLGCFVFPLSPLKYLSIPTHVYCIAAAELPHASLCDIYQHSTNFFM